MLHAWMGRLGGATPMMPEIERAVVDERELRAIPE